MAFVAIFQTQSGFVQLSSRNADPVGGALRYEGDSSAVPQSLKDEMIAAEPLTLDWLSVRIALLGDVAYNEIAAAATDQRAVTRLEAAAMNSTHEWALLAQLWNAVIGSLPAAPPAADIAAIAAILSEGHLPVELDPVTGLMAPTNV